MKASDAQTKFLEEKFSLYFIVAIANASPILNCTIVDDVGTIFPGPASFTSGIRSRMSEALYNKEFFFETIPIKKILFLTIKSFLMIESRKDVNEGDPKILITSPLSHKDELTMLKLCLVSKNSNWSPVYVGASVSPDEILFTYIHHKLRSLRQSSSFALDL